MSEGIYEGDEDVAGSQDPEQDRSEVQNDIESKAEELKDDSPDQHLGDAMDDVDLEPPSS